MSSDVAPQPADRIDNLPTDELRRYARRLGLHPEEDLHHHELLDLVRDRHQAISSLERDALLDVVIWARRPVRRSASKEDLVTEVTEVQRNKFDKLSQRGLEALAVVRNVPVRPGEPRQLLERRLRKAGGWTATMRRFRRRVVANLISKALQGNEDQEYQFLPDTGPTGSPATTTATAEPAETEPAAEHATVRPAVSHESLRRRIQRDGIVPALAGGLRDVADDYVAQKLDEIERRIDRKLDEIDARLAEWRDREVQNRLKILKITLVVSIFVAVICFVYDVVAPRLYPINQSPPPAITQPATPQPVAPRSADPATLRLP